MVLLLGTFNTLVPGTVVVKFDTNGDGVYDYTLDSSQYVLEPQNWDGPEDSPYTQLRLAVGVVFPYVYTGRVYTVQITGTWGWPAVPAMVKQACRMQVARILKRADSPLGLAGSPEFGLARVPNQLDTDVRQMIDPYVHDDHFGVAG